MALDFPTSTVQLAIGLSREELYTVMRLLKLKSLPGFDLRWLRRQPDGTLSDDMRYSLEVAISGLIARGYLVPRQIKEDTKEIEVSLPALIIALVGACSFAEYSILLSLRKENRHHQMYLHEFRGLAVAHSMPMTDIHQFAALDGRQGLLQRIDHTLGLNTQIISEVSWGRVPAVLVQAARDDALAGKVDKAAAALVQGGLFPDTAQVLSQAMNEATTLGTVAIRGQDSAEAWKAAISLVITPYICFMLFANRTESHMLEVHPTSANELQKWFSSQIS